MLTLDFGHGKMATKPTVALQACGRKDQHVKAYGKTCEGMHSAYDYKVI